MGCVRSFLWCGKDGSKGIDLAVGSSAVLAQKPEAMFGAFDFLNKGVFSPTRTRAESYSVSGAGFSGVSLEPFASLAIDCGIRVSTPNSFLG